MKRFAVVAALVATAALAGCNANNPTDRALAGGAIGGGTGAVIAAAAGANPGTVLGVAAASAVGGAVLGAATTPRSNCLDGNGNRLPPGRYTLPDGQTVNCS